jgi:20S proteasome alpha/beta subunit
MITPKSDIDLSLHLYTEDGQIAQVVYAGAALQKSRTRITFLDEAANLVTSLAIRPIRSRLCSGIMKGIQTIEGTPFMCGSAGYAADCQHVLNYFNQMVQNHCFLYGEPPNVDYLCHHLSQWVVRGMYGTDEDKLTRPLATSLVLAGYDRDAGRLRLVEIENNGYFSEKKVSIVGGKLTSSRRVSVLRGLSDGVANSHNDDPREKWLAKCESCLQSLVEDLQEQEVLEASVDDGEEVSYGVECCVVDSAGRVHQPLQDLPSVQQTIEWLRTLPSGRKSRTSQ